MQMSWQLTKAKRAGRGSSGAGAVSVRYLTLQNGVPLENYSPVFLGSSDNGWAGTLTVESVIVRNNNNAFYQPVQMRSTCRAASVPCAPPPPAPRTRPQASSSVVGNADALPVGESMTEPLAEDCEDD